MWPFKRRYLDKQALDLRENWSLSHGKHGANPMIVRVNRGVAAAVGHPQYTHQVGVAIPLNAPDATGFPGPEESLELNVLEDMLVAALEGQRLCIHVATISTGGMREFVFYSSGPKATHELLESLVPQLTTHKIQHIVRPDPQWHVYKQFS